MTKKKISEKELDMIENIAKESLFKKKQKLTKAKEGKMLVGNQKKLDKNKDGKISEIDFKMMKKARVGKSIESSGSKKVKSDDMKRKKLKELREKGGGPVEEAKLMGNMKYMGGEAKGYGAARTQGEGLQDENLIPGKSLDYYKDIM